VFHALTVMCFGCAALLLFARPPRRKPQLA